MISLYDFRSITLEDCARYISTEVLDRTVYDLDSLVSSSVGLDEGVNVLSDGSQQSGGVRTGGSYSGSGVVERCGGGSGKQMECAGGGGSGVVERCGGGSGKQVECAGGGGSGVVERCGGGSGKQVECAGGGGSQKDISVGSGELEGWGGEQEECAGGCDQFEGCGGGGGRLEECAGGTGEQKGWGGGCKRGEIEECDDSLCFESRFECGNLRKAIQVIFLYIQFHIMQLTLLCFRSDRMSMIWFSIQTSTVATITNGSTSRSEQPPNTLCQ